MKPDRLVDDIKARIDIVDVVSERLSLRKSGQNYKGICPFHPEKTPSFMVHPARQIFHCFGCGKGGDVITFIMEHEQMTFGEAIEFLARRAGIATDRYARAKGESRNIREQIFSVNEMASRFFRDNLGTSAKTSAYLRERGITGETVEQFQLGYSGTERNGLLRHLRSCAISEDLMKLSGLIYLGEKGACDFFRDRLMFPLVDVQGRVIAFGGRILSADAHGPKYLNSPESPVFRKSDALFGLNFGRQEISRKDYAVVVEGYLDVISCHQSGLANVVAPLGTSLTAGHLRILKRYSGKVLILFDGDQAGVAAAKRALDLVFAESITAKILLLPDGEDPDSFVRAHGGEKLRHYLGSALSPVQFILKLYGKNRLDAVRLCLSFLSRCPDGLLREQTLGELAEQSRISEPVLRDELKVLMQKQRKPPFSDSPKSALSQSRTSQSTIDAPGEEVILLSIALSLPEKAHAIANHLDLASLRHSEIRNLFGIIRRLSGRDDERDLIPRILDACNAEEKNLVTHLLVDPQIDIERADKSVRDCLRAIAVRRIEQEVRTAEDKGDTEALRRLLSEKSILLGGGTAFGHVPAESVRREE